MNNNEEYMLEGEIWDEVMSDFFPNAETEEDLMSEIDCWNND